MKSRTKNPKTTKAKFKESPWPWVIGITAVVGAIYFLGEGKRSPLA